MIELGRIYNEDCLETMKRMEDKSVDLIVTSPPYNIGNNHHTDGVRHNPYDDDMDEEVYQAWQLAILRESYRVLTDGGWVFYNHKNRIRNFRMITPYSWILRSELTLRQELNWNNGTHNFDKCRFYPRSERIYCLAKGDAKMVNELSLTDDWHIEPVGTDGVHKRAFPFEIPRNCIASVPNASVVYDPFMGSGTTAVACEKLGRRWIGSEINPDYCKIAEKRIEAVRAQGNLFP